MNVKIISDALNVGFSLKIKPAAFYAALLPGRGPHYASHSVCPSVCLSVRPVIVAVGHVFSAPLASRMYFSARTEGRISYGISAAQILF